MPEAPRLYADNANLGWRTMLRIIAALVATSLLCAQAQAEDGIPFPELKFETYCTTLVSKMLDKGEQTTELSLCMANENRLRAALEPYWSLVPARTKKQILTHFTAPMRETYTIVYGYERSAIGDACLQGIIKCPFPE